MGKNPLAADAFGVARRSLATALGTSSCSRYRYTPWIRSQLPKGSSCLSTRPSIVR